MALGGLVLAMSGPAGAEETAYFGFRLGETDRDAVMAKLDEREAAYNAAYGYKGFTELRKIKVTEYDRFAKYGPLDVAWLAFTPERELYKLEITWNDAGKTFKGLKDVLDRKYGTGEARGWLLEETYRYRDDDVTVTLNRSTFSPGQDRKTTLTYVYEPATEAVARMKNKIEQSLEAPNPLEAFNDL
ncbi:MAG: hypothetical protein ABEK42_12380 [Thiohalorhabdaceae bacterium]